MEKRKGWKVNNKVSFSKMKLSAAHGYLKLKQLKKIPKILVDAFSCVDALSYSHLAEGKLMLWYSVLINMDIHALSL